MKHVLYSCDSCPKTVPEKATRGWWGCNDPKNQAVPQFEFKPIAKKMKQEFAHHFCSQECLFKWLAVRAGAVNMQAVATAKEPESTNYFSLMNSFMFGGPSSAGSSNSIGYYGKKKEEAEEDEDGE